MSELFIKETIEVIFENEKPYTKLPEGAHCFECITY